MPRNHPVDVHFHLEGPATHCCVTRAWNAAPEAQRQVWEFWPSPKPNALELPRAQAAVKRVGATPEAQQKAAVDALHQCIAPLKAKFENLRRRQRHAYLGLNTTNTVSAGLAVASAFTLWLPPVSVGFGLGSAAVGVSASTSEIVVDTFRDRELRGYVNDLKWQVQGFEAVHERLMVAALRDLMDDGEYKWISDHWGNYIQPPKLLLKDAAWNGVNGVMALEKSMAAVSAQKAALDGEKAAKALIDAVDAAVAYNPAAGLDDLMDVAPLLQARAEAQATVELANEARNVGNLKVLGNAMSVAGAVVAVGACAYGWYATKDNVRKTDDAIKSLSELDERLQGINLH